MVFFPCALSKRTAEASCVSLCDIARLIIILKSKWREEESRTYVYVNCGMRALNM